MKIKAKHSRGFLDIFSKTNNLKNPLRPNQEIEISDLLYYDDIIQMLISKNLIEITQMPLFINSSNNSEENSYSPSISEEEIRGIAQSVSISLISEHLSSNQPVNLFDINLDAMGPNDDGKVLIFRYVPPDNYGDGSDGDIEITQNETIINKYAEVISDIPQGGVSLIVNATAEFSDFNVGDTIMIHQTQIHRGGVFGNYEFNKIESINSNVVGLFSATKNAYYSDSGPGGVAESTKTQIVRIPNYRNVVISGGNIQATRWTGRVGGIISFLCNGILSGETATSIWARETGFKPSEGQYGLDSTNLTGVAGNTNRSGAGHGDGIIITAGYQKAIGEGTLDLTKRLIFGGGGKLYQGGGAICIYAANCIYSGKLISKSWSDNNQRVAGGCGSVYINTPVFTGTYEVVCSSGYYKGGSGQFVHDTVVDGTPTKKLTVSSKKDSGIS